MVVPFPRTITALKRLKPLVGHADDHPINHQIVRRAAKAHGAHSVHFKSPAAMRSFLVRRLEWLDSLERKTLGILVRARAEKKRSELRKYIAHIRELKEKPFHAVVLDIHMPSNNPTGVALMHQLKERFPTMERLFFSDASDLLMELQIEHGYGFVDKTEHEAEKSLTRHVGNMLVRATAKSSLSKEAQKVAKK